MSPLRVRLVSVISAVLLLAAACSSAPAPSDDASAPAPASTAADPSPASTDESTRAAVETTEPEVLAAQSLSEVFVAPNGNDGNSGAAPAQAVRTVGAALDRLAPGGVITFTAGTYRPLVLRNLTGTAGAPLRFRAQGNVEFRDSDYRSGAGILIENSRHITISGMNVRRSLWGVMIENSHNVTVVGLDVRDIGQEGIRVKEGSTHVRLERNTVADTGRRTDQGRPNGEGIYIGTGSPGGVDHVSHIDVIDNRIVRTTDEAIDVKRPATNVVLRGNEVVDVVTHTSGAIVVHLNGDGPNDPNILIEDNVIRNVTRSSPYRDGNCIVTQTTTTIVNNVLHGCQHRGIYVRGNAGTAFIRHNTLIATGDIGAIVSDNRGQAIVSENNLGADGSTNRRTATDSYVDAGAGNYRLTVRAAQELATAPFVGISRDMLGNQRVQAGPVTFGAVEAAPPTTTPAPAPASTPTTTTTVPPTTTSTQPTSAPSTTTPAGTAAPGTTDAPTTVPTTSAEPAAAPATVASRPRPGGGRPTPSRPVPRSSSSSADGVAATETPSTPVVEADTPTTPESPDAPATTDAPFELSCLRDLSCDWAPFL